METVNDKVTPNIQRMARNMEAGMDAQNIIASEMIHSKTNLLRTGWTPEETQDYLEQARALVTAMRPQKAAAKIGATHDQLEAALGDFGRAADARNLCAPHHLERATAALSTYITPAFMEKANAELARMRVGPITLNDIAFIGIIHWNSISNQSGESPMSRISKASVSFGYRGNEFDRRQIALALKLLTTLKVCRQVAPARFLGRGNKENKAAVWINSPQMEWQNAFAQKTESRVDFG